MEMTLLERAAEVRERRAAIERTCQELRQLKGNWTAHAIAADEAMKIADDGLRNAWAMLDRLNQLAKAEIFASLRYRPEPYPKAPNASLSGLAPAGEEQK